MLSFRMHNPGGVSHTTATIGFRRAYHSIFANLHDQPYCCVMDTFDYDWLHGVSVVHAVVLTVFVEVNWSRKRIYNTVEDW